MSQSCTFSALEESRQMRLHLIRCVINLGCLGKCFQYLREKWMENSSMNLKGLYFKCLYAF